MSRQLTIRNVPDEIAEKLVRISKEKGVSMNSTVLELLQEALGENRRRARLVRYATWSPKDFEEFESSLAEQRVVDDSLWR